MNVTQGTAPKNVDKNVRFRTTYYFRVFDYCWQANQPLQANLTYQQIVPETDTLYRYRMTGKASALGSIIKFEAGTLKASDIDPFGTQVTYNADVGGFQSRTAAQVDEDAKRIGDARAAAATRSEALDRFAQLSAMRHTAEALPVGEERTAIVAALNSALTASLAAYTGAPSALSSADHALLAKVETDLAALSTKVDAAKAGAPADTTVIDAAAAKAAAAVIADLKNAIAGIKPVQEAQPHILSDLCQGGSIQRRGFQIMGPEGMRPFDQDARLIMAMFTSAKPLTSTLQEYAGRVTRTKVNPAERLLPLAKEDVRAMEAGRTLDRLGAKAGSDPAISVDSILSDTLAAFSGNSGQ